MSAILPFSDLTTAKVESVESLLEHVNGGLNLRIVATNSKNSGSSRGHALLTLEIRNETYQSTYGECLWMCICQTLEGLQLDLLLFFVCVGRGGKGWQWGEGAVSKCEYYTLTGVSCFLYRKIGLHWFSRKWTRRRCYEFWQADTVRLNIWMGWEGKAVGVLV